MDGQQNLSLVNALLDTSRVIEKINAGEFLILAADESVLQQLPSGNWIAGTSPYFMTQDQGGCTNQAQIYTTTIEGLNASNPARITLYDHNTISRIALEAPSNGFTVLVIPAGSEVHSNYAENAPDFENMFYSPIIGWIAGTHLDTLGSQSAKVGFGPASGMLSDTQAVAMHIPLPDDQTANIGTVNLFTAKKDSPVIRFPQKGFSVNSCLINGEEKNLANYLKHHAIDTRLPLVADYSGVVVNASIQEVNNDTVTLYAPVFSDTDYRFAAPITDYVNEFNRELAGKNLNNTLSTLSCNCILNFLYSELEGKQTGDLNGPIVFGEIAYQLLNQTLVYMTLDKQQ